MYRWNIVRVKSYRWDKNIFFYEICFYYCEWAEFVFGVAMRGYRIQPWPWATDSLVLFEASLWASVGLVSLRGPVFLGSKPPEVMLFVECSLSDAAIACASWCGSWCVGFGAVVLLLCRSFWWRVYGFSDVFRVSQSVVWCGKDVWQVQGQTCIDHVQCSWNSVNFDVPFCGGPFGQFRGKRELSFLCGTSERGDPFFRHIEWCDVGI